MAVESTEVDAETGDVMFKDGVPIYKYYDSSGRALWTFEAPDDDDAELDELLREPPAPGPAGPPTWLSYTWGWVNYLGEHCASLLGATEPMFLQQWEDHEMDKKRDEEEREFVDEQQQQLLTENQPDAAANLHTH